MLQLANTSPWAADLTPGWSLDSTPQWTATIKATYRIGLDGEVALCDEQPDVVAGDLYRGKPSESSLQAAWESVPHKAGGEFYVFGTAQPKRADSTGTQIRVRVDRGNGDAREKRLMAIGPCEWKRGALGWYRSDPAPMSPVPIIYEMAYGGRDPRTGGEERSNPVGRGYNSGLWRLYDTRLPQIERPDELLSTPRQRVEPIGLGPLAPHWEPRRREAGNVSEERLEAGGCPYGTKTAPTVHNSAPVDQRFATPFRGGERVTLEGLIAPCDAPVTFTLPALAPTVWLQESARTPLRGVCDTLIIDSDALVFHLLYRCAIPWAIDDKRRGYVVVPPVPDTSVNEPASADEGAPA